MIRNSYSKTYQELTFTDDYMFCKVLENNPEVCRKLIELILGVEVREIRYKKSQHRIDPNPDKKSIRLDVYLSDGTTIFDLEMQTQHKRILPRRSRYYQALIDIDNLSKGSNYNDLPDSYIIFICTFDPFGDGLPKYTFRQMCKEIRPKDLGDGTTKVFVNARSKMDDVSEDMRAFLDYLCGEEPSSNLTCELEDCVFRAKLNQEWEMEYMQFRDYIDDVREDAREEALVEGTAIGENRFAKLSRQLVMDSRIEDLMRATEDMDFRASLYEEFKIK